MLPEFPPNLRNLPRPLVFVRDLEEFDGPILSEYRAEQGGLYLEKWCAHDESIVRTLVVRTEQRAVAEYLAKRITMLTLLTGPSDDVGFIVDWADGKRQAVYMVRVSDLPPKYLPKPNAMHDESLRPEWDRVPQSFLLNEDWDAELLARTERLYQNAFSFNLLTQPGNNLSLPSDIFTYDYDRGYPVVQAFNRIRDAVPRDMRVKAGGVSANSPGVLTIDAPRDAAEHLLNALSALRRSSGAYDNVYAWSRLKPQKVDKVPPQAIDHLRRLCDLLGIDVTKVLPPLAGNRVPEPIDVLVAGKLVAAYYRRLWTLVDPEGGVEFLGVDAPPTQSTPSLLLFEEEEDEDEWG